MNKNKLRAVIVAHGETQEILADALGLPSSALTARMNGTTAFRQNEMDIIKKRYCLNAQQMVEIFFED